MYRNKSFILGFISIISIIFITGCIQPDSIINVELNVPFQLKIGQVGFLKSEQIKIFFLNITEDSRCPSDVDCIWPGQVTVVINICKNFQSLRTLNLTILGTYGPAIKEFGIYSIKLIKVEPYPISNQTIELSDYNATFLVSKI